MKQFAENGLDAYLRLGYFTIIWVLNQKTPKFWIGCDFSKKSFLPKINCSCQMTCINRSKHTKKLDLEDDAKCYALYIVSPLEDDHELTSDTDILYDLETGLYRFESVNHSMS